mmetsp:Transcript_30572/g.86453  ORF Transcript_30572/g.86453 Transcript_30572/m.86453 type:complete len:921 (+) Transcript_30572:1966-4728(+)
MHTAFLHLCTEEAIRSVLQPVISSLPSTSARILLTGPQGSELYLEAVVSALASHHRASLLVYDRASLGLGDEDASSGDPSVSGSRKESIILDEIARSLGEKTKSSRGTGTDDPTSVPGFFFCRKTMERSLDRKQAKATSEGANRSSSDEALDALFMQKGDRVRFVGATGLPRFSKSGSLSLHVASLLWPPSRVGPSSQPGKDSSSERSHTRGPFFNCPGRIVLAFRTKPNKVGVRFDYAILGGTNLGGLCDEGHGYWCSVSDLKLEGSSKAEEAESAAVDALFEVAAEQAASAPLIILVKDVEKAVMGHVERFLHFKRRAEKLPPHVLLIGQHPSMDSRRDSPGRTGMFARMGMVGTGLTGHAASVLDLPFLDSLRPGGGDGPMGASRLEQPKMIRMLQRLLPNRIILHAPQEDKALAEWRRCMERDASLIRERANRQAILRVAKRCGVEVEESEALVIQQEQLSAEDAEKVLGWSISTQLMRKDEDGTQGQHSAAPPAEVFVPGKPDSAEETDSAAVDSTRLAVSVSSVQAAMDLLRAATAESAASGTDRKGNSVQDVQTDNEFEKRLLGEVVPANEVGVSFDDIGALDAVKTTLREVVMLPLQRPELFARGSLTKPTRGVLLFGPPGTGKTMLAKAVATESGANFLNISMAMLASKWFGEGEKYVRALFTLAHKIAPSVIFIDEVDSMLGRRDKTGEHEAMRKIKNEFMANWDGLKTKECDRVLVLAATNRPYDLDEAVIRRMPRRLMVDLPDVANRTKILSVILKDEELEPGFDMEALAAMTEGYSGSDLRNLCVAAAYRPIRDFLEVERKGKGELQDGGKSAGGAEGSAAERSAGKAPPSVPAKEGESEPEGGAAGSSDPAPVQLRPLTLEDLLCAKEEVCASVASDASSMSELRQWNEMYGEGGSRRHSTLTYFM